MSCVDVAAAMTSPIGTTKKVVSKWTELGMQIDCINLLWPSIENRFHFYPTPVRSSTVLEVAQKQRTLSVLLQTFVDASWPPLHCFCDVCGLSGPLLPCIACLSAKAKDILLGKVPSARKGLLLALSAAVLNQARLGCRNCVASISLLLQFLNTFAFRALVKIFGCWILDGVNAHTWCYRLGPLRKACASTSILIYAQKLLSTVGVQTQAGRATFAFTQAVLSAICLECCVLDLGTKVSLCLMWYLNLCREPNLDSTCQTEQDAQSTLLIGAKLVGVMPSWKSDSALGKRHCKQGNFARGRRPCFVWQKFRV